VIPPLPELASVSAIWPIDTHRHHSGYHPEFSTVHGSLTSEPSDKKALFSPVAGSNWHPKIFLPAPLTLYNSSRLKSL
jgi:hypothetical protein